MTATNFSHEHLTELTVIDMGVTVWQVMIPPGSSVTPPPHVLTLINTPGVIVQQRLVEVPKEEAPVPERRYPIETFDDHDTDDGTMPENVARLEEAVVGHRIVSAGIEKVKMGWRDGPAFVLTLDTGKRVILRDTDDCCAYTALEKFLMDPRAVDHAILGVGTTEGYTRWHIYADFGDVMELQVGWSCGNPFYYGYGFDITVEEIPS